MKHITADTLSFYRNCKIEYFDYFTNKYKIGTLQGIADDHHFFIKEDGSGQEIDKCKPILRPISDITDAELKELFMMDNSFEEVTMSYLKFSHREEHIGYFSVRFNCEYINKMGKKSGMMGTISFMRLTPKQFQYILSMHFDIFGWIKNGIAIAGELRNVPAPLTEQHVDKNLFPPINNL